MQTGPLQQKLQNNGIDLTQLLNPVLNLFQPPQPEQLPTTLHSEETSTSFARRPERLTKKYLLELLETGEPFYLCDPSPLSSFSPTLSSCSSAESSENEEDAEEEEEEDPFIQQPDSDPTHLPNRSFLELSPRLILQENEPSKEKEEESPEENEPSFVLKCECTYPPPLPNKIFHLFFLIFQTITFLTFFFPYSKTKTLLGMTFQPFSLTPLPPITFNLFQTRTSQTNN